MRVVEMKLLPDGSGRVRIHWFQICEDGPAKTPAGTVNTSAGSWEMCGVQGRIACTPARDNVLPQYQGQVIHLTCRSEDPRAVTCPECQATEDYKAAMKGYELLVDTANPVQSSDARSFSEAGQA